MCNVYIFSYKGRIWGMVFVVTLPLEVLIFFLVIDCSFALCQGSDKGPCRWSQPGRHVHSVGNVWRSGRATSVLTWLWLCRCRSARRRWRHQAEGHCWTLSPLSCTCVAVLLLLWGQVLEIRSRVVISGLDKTFITWFVSADSVSRNYGRTLLQNYFQ